MNSNLKTERKRKISNITISDDSDNDIKIIKTDDIDQNNIPLCKYGIDCYRTNPDHLKEYSHPFGMKLT